jgi:hypothetical protein
MLVIVASHEGLVLMIALSALFALEMLERFERKLLLGWQRSGRTDDR